MSATTVRSTAADWLAVISQVESTIESSLEQSARHEALLADVAPSPTGKAKRAQNRLDERIRQLSQRVAEAELSADEVSNELASAEMELRLWAEQVAGIAKRIDIIVQ